MVESQGRKKREKNDLTCTYQRQYCQMVIQVRLAEDLDSYKETSGNKQGADTDNNTYCQHDVWAFVFGRVGFRHGGIGYRLRGCYGA